MDQAATDIKAMLRGAEDDLERQLASIASAADVASAAESHYSDLHARLLDWQVYATQLENVCSDLHARRLDWQAHAKLLEKVLEDERCAHAVRLEETDRALEAERRTLVAQFEEKDRAFDAERCALATQLEEKDRALESAVQLKEQGRALEEERRALAAQLEEKDRALDKGRRAFEEKDRALDAERRAHATQLEEKDRTLDTERRAFATQLEEKDRALDAERRARTTQLEAKDRTLETERSAFATQLVEKDRAFESAVYFKEKSRVREEERRALAAQLEEKDRAMEKERRAFEEKDRALDAERRAHTTQLEEKDRTLETERRAFAAQLEEKDRALDAERRALGAQGVSRVAGQGVAWQYYANGEWIEMPSECGLELTRRYQAGTGSGGDDATSTFSCQSGTEQYEFNLRAMLQTNLRTLTQRDIRCVVHSPLHWARCTSVDAIRKASATPARTVELTGFYDRDRDGVYVESAYESHGGKALWWKHDGTRFIKWNRNVLAWHMCSVGSDFLQRRNGNAGVCGARTREDPDHGGSWEEKYTGRWPSAYYVQSTAPAPANPISPFMNIAVELLDTSTRVWFRELLFDTAHQQPHPGYGSRCTDFRDTFKIVRVLRVENWNLLTKYRTHVHHMKQDLEKYGIWPAAVEPQLPGALDEALTHYGGGDADINECFLFHGTSFQVAASIAQEGFDFRVADAGYYGYGTYFASQSCKSFQYSGGGGDELGTIIVSRVALGDVMYATCVDWERCRPELRDGTLRCYDSIVARPGPMPGHQHGHQTHQEFVIFEKFQAYPEFIVQFTCSA